MAAAKKTTKTKSKPIKPAVIKAKRDVFTGADFEKVAKGHTKTEWVFIALIFGHCITKLYNYVGEELPEQFDPSKDVKKLIRKIRAK